MTAVTLTDEEALSLDIAPGLRKLLSPEEVGRLGILPIAGTDDGLMVAAGPGCAANAELLLRMRLGVGSVEVRPASWRAIETILENHFLPYWKEKGWSFPGFSRNAPAADLYKHFGITAERVVDAVRTLVHRAAHQGQPSLPEHIVPGAH